MAPIPTRAPFNIRMNQSIAPLPCTSSAGAGARTGSSSSGAPSRFLSTTLTDLSFSAMIPHPLTKRGREKALLHLTGRSTKQRVRKNALQQTPDYSKGGMEWANGHVVISGNRILRCSEPMRGDAHEITLHGGRQDGKSVILYYN